MCLELVACTCIHDYVLTCSSYVHVQVIGMWTVWTCERFLKDVTKLVSLSKYCVVFVYSIINLVNILQVSHE